MNSKLGAFSICVSLALLSLSGQAFAKTSLKDAIENSTISGFAFLKNTVVNGNDGEGTRYQMRFKPTITTGAIEGWSFSAGILFSLGSSTPNNNYTHNDVQGSRAVRADQSGSDVFNIANFYLSKTFADTKSSFKFGAYNLDSPFTSSGLDRGIGASFISKDIDSANLSISWYDTWITDNFYIRQGNGGSTNVPDISSSSFSKGIGIGNDLIAIGIDSSPSFTKDTGLNYRLWVSYIEKLVNASVFAQIGYNIDLGDKNTLSILTQATFTAIDKKNSRFLTGTNARNRSTKLSSAKLSDPNVATYRGVANASLTLKSVFDEGVLDSEDEFKYQDYASITLGYASSFSQGYGALLNSNGGFKVGSGLWNGIRGDSANGFMLIGTGGLKGSKFSLIYGDIKFGYGRAILGLGVLRLDDSNFAVLSKGNTRLSKIKTAVGNIKSAGIAIQQGYSVKFIEVNPSVTYRFTKDLRFVTQYGIAFGDVSLNRWVFTATYNF